MLSPRATGLRRQSRLAISLSWVAGYVNVIGLIALGYTVSHQTGNVTSLARSLSDRNMPMLVTHVTVVVSFFLGAALSGGLMAMADRAGAGSKYIAPIAAEAGLLLVLSFGITLWLRHHTAAASAPVELSSIGALAMGLQNATITRISGSVVRTTHLTGVITDLGLEGIHLVVWWRDITRGDRKWRIVRSFRVMHRQAAFKRLVLLLSIFGSYLFGAVAGACVFLRWPASSLLPPAAFLLLLVWSNGPRWWRWFS